MGHAGESFHAILGAAAALRGLLIAGMGAGLLTPSCGGNTSEREPSVEQPEREFVCEETVSLPGGFVRCQSGSIQRTEVAACAGPAAPFEVSEADRSRAVMLRDCSADSDCTRHPDGFCQQFTDSYGGAFLHCVYPCVTDNDCGQGYACFCGSRGGECVPAECSSGADCADSACVTLYTAFDCTPTQPRLACWTKELECDSVYCGGSSAACIEGACVRKPVCGRPFLIDSVERRADVVSRRGWSPETLADDVGNESELDPAVRAALAAHWSRSAAMEHASIAAFARFSLQLLSLGAPSNLVERTARALADETRHTQICFALASRYAGEQLGPAPLAIDGCLESVELRGIVETAFVEACIGETTAALEAYEAARLARDPVVQQALLGIARDESAHAELGFAFVSWILDTRPELREELAVSLRARLARERELGGAACPPTADNSERAELSDHGVLPPSTSAWIRRLALSTVVEPCLERLLAPTLVRPSPALEAPHGSLTRKSEAWVGRQNSGARARRLRPLRRSTRSHQLRLGPSKS